MNSLKITRQRLVAATCVLALNMILAGVSLGQYPGAMDIPPTIEWTGTTDKNWFTPANWSASSARTPSSTDSVSINTTAIHETSLSGGIPETVTLLRVGGLSAGTGSLTIENGGQLTARPRFINGEPDKGGFVLVGDGPATSGTITITGRLSSLTASFSRIGEDGTGVVNILDGGKFTVPGMVVGNTRTGRGTISVDGPGSTFVANVDGLTLGFARTADTGAGMGTLNIRNGGRVEAADVLLAVMSGGIGTLNIGAPPGQTPVAPGTLVTPFVTFGNPGTGTGGGTGTINFNHTSTDYIFAPAILQGTGNGVVNVLAGTTIFTAGGTPGGNTYTGQTTISGGTAVLAAGGVNVFSASSPTVVTNGGTLDLGGFGETINSVMLAGGTIQNGSLTGAVSSQGGTVNGIGGTASLTTTANLTTVLGANTYTGGTTISGGTLQLGNGGTTGSIVGNVTNNGTLAFNRSDTVTFSGVISGTGSVAQIGSGRTILTGQNTYSGGTIFEAGILAVEGNGHLGTGPLTFNGGILQDLTGADLLTNVDIKLGPTGGTFLADPATTSALNGTISGPGSFTKTGPGTLILTGNNTFSGGTTINEGTLVVGVPAGSGSLTSFALGTGNVFLNAGTLRTTSLDPQPLIINVGGNYTQGPGGTLALGIGGLRGRDYDHVLVGGNAFLNGTLAVSSLSGFRPANLNAFAVLHANGTRSGQFAQVTDSFNNNPNLFRSDFYFANAVVLFYKAAPALPPTIVIPTRIAPPNPNEPLSLRLLLEPLNPTAEQLTALFEIPFSSANIQRLNLDDRMTQIQRTIVPPPAAPLAPLPPPTGKEAVGGKETVGKAPPPPPPVPSAPRFGVWANGWGDFVHIDDSGFAKGYRFTTGGMSAGIDYRITDHFAVGLFGGYSHTWMDFRPGDGEVDTGRGGLYATYFDPTGWWINAGAWGGYNSYSTKRQGLLGLASGSTEGYEFSTFGDAGYNIYLGKLTFGPIVAMQYTNAHISGFSEHGSLVPLDVHADSEDSLRTDLGAQASYNWQVGNISVIPGLRLAWQHEFKYSRLPITASAPIFGGATTTLNGPHLGHDSLLINANVGIQCSSRIAITIGYDGQLVRDNYSSHAVTGTFSFSF